MCSWPRLVTKQHEWHMPLMAREAWLHQQRWDPDSSEQGAPTDNAGAVGIVGSGEH